MRDLHERHPNYLFARIALAEEAIDGRDYEAARTLLNPLMQKRRFHLSEYTALCHAHIKLLSTQGEHEGARAWLEMWQDVAPDDERTMYWSAAPQQTRPAEQILSVGIDRGEKCV